MSELPAGRPDRHPLDVFDPSADGVTPYTLEDVVDAATAVHESLEAFRAALLGCRTPLALWREEHQAKKLAEQTTAWLRTLLAAQEIIELDLPLADRLGGEDLTDAWTADENVRSPLSPHSILKLNAAASGSPLHQLTTYRKEVQRGGKVPFLISRRRREAERVAAEEKILHPGPDATPEQRKAAANAKRMKIRAANRAAKAARSL